MLGMQNNIFLLEMAKEEREKRREVPTRHHQESLPEHTVATVHGVLWASTHSILTTVSIIWTLPL